MATPEERKAQLQAAWRQQGEAAVLRWGNTNSEFGTSRAADREQTQEQRQEKARQMDVIQEDQEDQEAAQRTRLLVGMQAAMAAQQAQQPSAEANTQTQLLQQETKKLAKAAFRRGVIFVMTSVAAAVDLGSSGVSLIIDIVIYLFTLGWLNVELFYGKIIMKGKSKLIAPLSWAPIPMPVDPGANILAAIVIAADIVVVLSVIWMMFSTICLFAGAVCLVGAGVLGYDIILSMFGS